MKYRKYRVELKKAIRKAKRNVRKLWLVKVGKIPRYSVSVLMGRG